jgi:cytochrome b6-f complex iron-sulfur subunit
MVKQTNNPPSSPSRRNVLSETWRFLGIVALLQCIVGAVFFLGSGRKKASRQEKQQLAAGLVTDFQPGSVTLIAQGHLYLTRLEDGGFLAISRKCTHLGCAVPWIAERKQFECPCHASIFDMTGNVLKSPAPRALNLFPITIENNQVMIDIANPVRRAGFASEQLVYPGELG